MPNKKNVVLKVSDSGVQLWLDSLKSNAPEYSFFSWKDHSLEPEDVAYLIASNPDVDWVNSHKQLKALFSVGSGTDHIRNIEKIRTDIPIVKATSPVLTQKMKQYVGGAILYWHRRFDRMIEANGNKLWVRVEAPLAKRLFIGVLGYGNMGSPVSQMLLDLGYNVRVLASAPRSLSDMEYFAGIERLDEFSTGLDALVCLLPSTSQTANIVNRRVFERLNDEACIVSVSRGACLDETDLAQFIQTGKIKTVFLDVCKVEPLPSSSDLWSLPNVFVTGHSSGYFGPNEGGEIVARLLRSFEFDQNSVNLFDRAKGY